MISYFYFEQSKQLLQTIIDPRVIYFKLTIFRMFNFHHLIKTMRSVLTVCCFFFALSFCFSQNHPVVSGHTLEQRMVRISTNFLVDDNLPPALEVITTAADNCYNGVIVADVKFGFLEAFANSPGYFRTE